MCKELDKYADNQKAINDGHKAAGMPSILEYSDLTVGDYLKELAKKNVDVTMGCVRPVGDAGESA